MFYTATPGSGASIQLGLYDYNDTATASTPISHTGGGAADELTNDELGSFTNKTYALPAVADVWDASTDVFDWSDLTLGDNVSIRLDCEVTTSSANQEWAIDLHLGTGGGAYTIPFSRGYAKTASANRVIEWKGIYMGDANTINNGGVFKISSANDLDVKVNGWYVRVDPRSI